MTQKEALYRHGGKLLAYYLSEYNSIKFEKKLSSIIIACSGTLIPLAFTISPLLGLVSLPGVVFGLCYREFVKQEERTVIEKINENIIYAKHYRALKKYSFV
jgi:hypothetical protein